MPAPDSLSLYQVGVQSAFGTSTAPTARLAVPRVDFEEAGERAVPAIAKGLVVRNRGDELAVMRQTNWSIDGAPVYYEQLQTFLLAAVAGGVSASGTAPDFTWTFTRDPAADPALDPLTLQRRASDFSSNDDIEVADCFVQELGISYSENAPLELSVSGFGRRNNDSATWASGLSHPTPEFIPSALSTLFIDDDWASLGTTQITSQVIGWEWTFNSGYMPQMSADGRTDLDYTVAVLNAEEVQMTLTITALMDITTYQAEKAKAVSQGERAVRIAAAGSGNKSLQIDGLYKFAAPDVLAFDNENGQVTVAYEMEETTDGTNLLSIELNNETDDVAGA